MRKEYIMIFGFSMENLEKRMRTDGTWKIRYVNVGDCVNITPKFRKDCMIGKRMLLSQARKVVESGFIKTHLDCDELAWEFCLEKNRVVEILQNYCRLVNGGWEYSDGSFASINEIFACLVTGSNVVDFHLGALENFFEPVTQYYAMELSEATHLERKECSYFCLLTTKLAGGDCFLGDGFVKVKSGFVGERYVQTVYDLSWFLAGKILGLLDESVTPMQFFEGKDWGRYNLYPKTPAYITKVMEVRDGMPGGVTTTEDIKELFDDRAVREMLLNKVIQKGDYLDIKLLEWATKIKGGYGEYMEML